MTDPKEILIKVLQSHQDSSKWIEAPFEHIKRVSNTKVGEVGQDFVEQLSISLGYECVFPINKRGARAKQNPWDISIEGVEFELKTATEDVNGAFQFNHLRYHRPYHGVICLGVSPDEIYFNIWSKAEVATGAAGTLVSMEKGANASYKLTKKPAGLYSINTFKPQLVSFLRKYKAAGQSDSWPSSSDAFRRPFRS